MSPMMQVGSLVDVKGRWHKTSLDDLNQAAVGRLEMADSRRRTLLLKLREVRQA